MSGRLISVAGPIGNLGDLSPRAVTALTEADFWLVEDSRVSGKLGHHLAIKKPMRLLNEHTGPGKIAEYADEIEAGSTAALLTDAGTPGISDPGALLTDLCLERDLEVDAIPGPSAVTTALMLSGFFAQQFAFLGFLPRKEGAMKEQLGAFADSTLTLVLFESPFRVEKLAEVAYAALGSRRIAFCRELTKMHQQICRVTLPDMPTASTMPRKGEFTVVIEGKRRKA
ncbi:MAG: 16S rRNA (cytidine(1402)-2'-O)-methyltransferase [Fimbriimonadaceae bacterium]|nr:16S rRNA (cytidine(1402)-2'-O)-methyltransferase [Fimbriimonadaceae bacterium]